MVRRQKLFFLAIFLIHFCGCGVSTGGSREGTGQIRTDNYANKELKYYYYIPDSMVGQTTDLLVCVPGLSGSGEKFVSRDIKKFAEENGIPIIAPTFIFDEMNWSARRSYHFPSHWSGDALVSIIENFQQNHDLKCKKMLLLGASAGAQFCQRFAMWKQEKCLTCAAYAAGGSIEFTRGSKVKFFVGIGTRDTDRLVFARNFRDSGRKYGVKIEYQEYPNGHEMPRAFIRDALDFLKRNQ